MLPYYALVAVPIFVSFIQSVRREKNKGKYDYLPIIVFFVIYFILLALRHKSIGSDTSGYLNVFSRLSNYSFKELLGYKETEYGYTFFNKFVSFFTDNKQVFTAIVAAISVFPIMILYKKESESPLISISLFLIFPVFIMNFSGFRQAIAIALGVPAFYAAKNKKIWHFLFIVLLAFSFHQSALILFLMYPLYHANIRPKHLLLLIPALILTYFNVGRIFNYVLPFLGEKYSESYSEIGDTGSYGMIFLLGLFVLFSFLMANESTLDGETKGMRNILVFTLFVQLFTSISAITMRMNYYYLIFIPILVSRVANQTTKVDGRAKQIMKFCIVAFFIVYYLNKAHKVDSLNIYPYIPFWK